VILLAGIPGSGKTTFGEYLRDAKGATHVDIEEAASRTASGADPHWDRFVRLGAARELVEWLGLGGRVGVLDWGFPPRLLGMVAALGQAGAELWWFDGDRQAAHAIYRSRSFKNSEVDWQAQFAAIEGAWPQIARVFDGHIVTTVMPGPRLSDPGNTAEQMGF
jgi:hypothetical protein